MELLTYVGIIGMVVGAIYLLLAAIARSTERGEETAGERDVPGRILLNMADAGYLDDLPTPDRMRKLAALCASAAGATFGDGFDFSLESVTKLDRAIAAGWRESTEQVHQDVILSLGAYLGEVLVRRTRGRWVTGMSEDDPANVLFLSPGDQQAVTFSPFLLIREKLDNVYATDLSIALTALEQKLKELHAV